MRNINSSKGTPCFQPEPVATIHAEHGWSQPHGRGPGTPTRATNTVGPVTVQYSNSGGTKVQRPVWSASALSSHDKHPQELTVPRRPAPVTRYKVRGIYDDHHYDVVSKGPLSSSAHSRSVQQLPTHSTIPPPPSVSTHKNDRLDAVIFLDVDGVLHSVQSTRQDQLFRQDKMSLLRTLVEKTGACICLSSAWRLNHQTMTIVNQQLVRHGLLPVIGKTGDYGPRGRRTEEILSWVQSHQPNAWIAIDDIDLLVGEPRMRGHFVHTNPLVGLTREGCERGIRMLRK